MKDIRKAKLEQLRKLELPEIQAGACELLKQFDAFCREHGIGYTLSGGTCLGAVRHGGMIPWDDDVDVDLPYPEFLKFLECVRDNPLPEGIEFLYGMRRGGANYIPKWCNTNTLALISARSRSRTFGQWLDLFPIFALSDDEQEAQEQLRIIHENSRYSWRWLNKPALIKSPRMWLKKTLLSDWKLRGCMNRITEACTRYPYGSTKYVHSVFVYDNEDVHPRKFPTELFARRTMLRFGETEYPVLEGYDTYLSTLYGPDYMTPPPEDKRGGHDHCLYSWR